MGVTKETDCAQLAQDLMVACSMLPTEYRIMPHAIEYREFPREVIFHLIGRLYPIDLSQSSRDPLRPILEKAALCGASDFHIDTATAPLSLSIRRDGVLLNNIPIEHPPAAFPNLFRIACRIPEAGAAAKKIQNGHFRREILGSPVDFRVSIIPKPAANSESISVRIFNQPELLYLENLGLDAAEQKLLACLVRDHHEGIALVIGCTGSGKTTLLYATMNLLKEQKRVVSLEDPVEQELAGITQLSIHPQRFVTFDTALREVYRHDPDVIVVGEIRDAQSARVTLEASHSHPVFSTLHAASLDQAHQKLREFNVPPAHMSWMVETRLERKPCSWCDAFPTMVGVKNLPCICGGTRYLGRDMRCTIFNF